MKVPLSAPLRAQLLTYVTTYGEATALLIFCTTSATLHKVLAGLPITEYTLSPFLQRLAEPEVLAARFEQHAIPFLSPQDMAKLRYLRDTEGHGRVATAIGISPITLNHLVDGTKKCRNEVIKHIIDSLPTLEAKLESVHRPTMGRPRKIDHSYALPADYISSEQWHANRLAEAKAASEASDREQEKGKQWGKDLARAEKAALPDTLQARITLAKQTTDQALLFRLIDEIEVENRTSDQPVPGLEPSLKEIVSRFKAMPPPCRGLATMVYFRDGTSTNLSSTASE